MTGSEYITDVLTTKFNIFGALLGMVGILIAFILWGVIIIKSLKRIIKHKRIFMVTNIAFLVLIAGILLIAAIGIIGSHFSTANDINQEGDLPVALDDLYRNMHLYVGIKHGFFARGYEIDYTVGFFPSIIASLLFWIEFITIIPIYFIVLKAIKLFILTLIVDGIYFASTYGVVKIRNFKFQREEILGGLNDKVDLIKAQKEWEEKQKNEGSKEEKNAALLNEAFNNKDKGGGAENSISAILNREREVVFGEVEKSPENMAERNVSSYKTSKTVDKKETIEKDEKKHDFSSMSTEELLAYAKRKTGN